MNQVIFTKPILVVEDDRKTSELLTLYLQREGFDTVAAYAGHQALNLAARCNPLLTILDVMLPDVDGWEICRRLRGRSDVPILFLSALGEDDDRVKGLTLGADDYMVKPFSFKELVARVHAILRRANGKHPVKPLLSHAGLTMDLAKHKVDLNNREIALTRSEFRLLHALMAAPGRVFERDELLGYLYPSGGVVIDRVVDVHIGKLRQKIEDDPAHPRYIQTARGVGYRFTEADSHSADGRGVDAALSL